MNIRTIISRLITSSEEQPIDIHGNAEARRRLLDRAQIGAEMRPVPTTSSDGHLVVEADAQAFERAIGRRYGIVDMGWDRVSMQRLDMLLDAVRDTAQHTFDRQTRIKAAAWVSEWVRQTHGLRRMPDGVMTDGRVAYDPLRRIDARLMSDEAPTLLDSIDTAISAIHVQIRNAA
jgi:hypothetical protein